MNYRRILVFGAHPDDETTMAGTMAKLASEGCEVHVAILTDGCEGYPDPGLKDRIVAMRRDEQAACDRVLGVTKRHNYDAPDQGLTCDKPTLLWCMRVIREVKPDAVFNHGPADVHNDHRRTHEVVRDAVFHAGQPVNAEIGAPHRTPHVYYYKAVREALPTVTVDVTDFCWKSAESRATQTSQHPLWNRFAKDWADLITKLKRERPTTAETFWICDQTKLRAFPDLENGTAT
ncbi:MAG TPA: PIG-L family deacetylase [Planctomycetota bacterium]|nr:PIG-L family deacetylase [Planctomycetota bacterium]